MALRSLGILSSRWRPAPDFLIVGTKRGGTTTLYRALMRHPDVRELFPAFLHIKSPHYFDLNYGKGPAWYRSHFPLALPGRPRRWQSGESSPYYLFHPLAARLAAQAAPDARIVVLLRDPVERAISHHWDRTKNGIEHLSLADAIAAEPERLAGERERLEADPRATSERYEHFSYVARGLYAGQLRTWLRHYPAERILVVRSEDLYRRPGEVIARVLSFLALAAMPPPPRERHHGNPDRPPVDPTLRAQLAETFARPNADLAAMLGTPLWWHAGGSADLAEPGIVRPPG